MASPENKLLLQMIMKLGLSDNEQLLPKATELLRLLHVKSGAGVTNLGDYAKVTICIDLASGLLGLPFDSEIALKMSGLKKTAYANSRRTLEKILDLNKPIGITEMCTQLGLNHIHKEAAALLESYQRYVSSNHSEIDFAHPQYIAMAIFQTCKKQKIKPPKSKLVSISHLKPAQWSVLEKNWDNFLATRSNKTQGKEQDEREAVNESADEQTTPTKQGNCLKHSSPEKIEPYVNWKKRILEKAYRELAAR